MRNFTLTLLTCLSALSVNAQIARVQAVHNCPDPVAATVDVWLNETLILDDISYKEASPFIDAPAGVNFDLSVCLPTSTDTTNAVYRKTFNLMNGTTHVIVASGGLAETGSMAFDLRTYLGLEDGVNPGNTQVTANFINGVYDSPVLDLYEAIMLHEEVGVDLSFGEEEGYINHPAEILEIQLRKQNMEALIQFDSDLINYEDSAMVIMTTGYFDPSTAVGSEPLGLLGIFPDGTVIQMTGDMDFTPARLQVIHNCAAADAATVDVWINDDMTTMIDNVSFRQASDFFNAPGGEFFDVSVTGSTSMDTTGALYREEVILESGKKYIAVASGTIGSGSYSPATPFDLIMIDEAREISFDPNNVDVMVFHGATDAPTIDVVETQVGAGTLVDNISYGEHAGYLELTPADYDLAITDASGMNTLYNFDADLSSMMGEAITILASGFVDPSANNNGADFGLWYVNGQGGPLMPLTNFTTVEDNVFEDLMAYPVPAEDQLTLSFNSTVSDQLKVNIYSRDGRLIQSSTEQVIAGANRFDINLTDIATGLYTISISTDESLQSIPVVVK